MSGQVKQVFLGYPSYFVKYKKFRKWFHSAEGELWTILASKIIRQSNNKGYDIPNYVYKNYYLKNKLATSWSLEALAKEMGYSSGKGNIYNLIKKLEEKQYIDRHVVKFEGKKTSIYVLGYKAKTKENEEILYVYERIKEEIAKEENRRFEGKRN